MNHDTNDKKVALGRGHGGKPLARSDIESAWRPHTNVSKRPHQSLFMRMGAADGFDDAGPGHKKRRVDDRDSEHLHLNKSKDPIKYDVGNKAEANGKVTTGGGMRFVSDFAGSAAENAGMERRRESGQGPIKTKVLRRLQPPPFPAPHASTSMTDTDARGARRPAPEVLSTPARRTAGPTVAFSSSYLSDSRLLTELRRLEAPAVNFSGAGVVHGSDANAKARIKTKHPLAPLTRRLAPPSSLLSAAKDNDDDGDRSENKRVDNSESRSRTPLRPLPLILPSKAPKEGMEGRRRMRAITERRVAKMHEEVGGGREGKEMKAISERRVGKEGEEEVAVWVEAGRLGARLGPGAEWGNARTGGLEGLEISPRKDGRSSGFVRDGLAMQAHEILTRSRNARALWYKELGASRARPSAAAASTSNIASTAPFLSRTIMRPPDLKLRLRGGVRVVSLGSRSSSSWYWRGGCGVVRGVVEGGGTKSGEMGKEVLILLSLRDRQGRDAVESLNSGFERGDGMGEAEIHVWKPWYEVEMDMDWSLNLGLEVGQGRGASDPSGSTDDVTDTIAGMVGGENRTRTDTVEWGRQRVLFCSRFSVDRSG